MSKSIVKNAIFKALLSIFNIIIPLLVGPYAYRTLGPDSIGRVNFSESIFNYFLILGSFGIYQYGIREISRIRDDKENLSTLFSSLFFIGLLSNIISLAVYIPLVVFKYGQSDSYSVLMIYSFNLIANIFYVEWANEALEKYNFITIKTICVRILYIILLFTLVKSSKDYNQYTFLIVLSSFLNNIISFFHIKKAIPLSFKGIKIKKHIKYLLMVLLLANGNILYTQLDRFMLGQYVSKADVSFYGMSQVIMYIVNTLMMSIIYVTIPRLSHYLGNNDEDTYISLLNKVTQVYFAFLFPAAVGMLILSKEIVLIYGGKDFINAIPILKVFSIYMISVGAESILSNQVMYVKRQEKILTIFIISCGVLNLILNIILLKTGFFNTITAISTTVISNYTLVILEYIYIKKVLKLDLEFLRWNKLKYFAISLLFIPITFILKRHISGLLAVTFSVVIVNASVYFLILYALKDDIILMFINYIFKKLKLNK